MMKRTLIFLVAALCSSCVTFYANPTLTDPAGIFVEKDDRPLLSVDRFRTISLAEIDGLPVSHMFTSSNGNEIRVEPGKRKILFQVRYRNEHLGNTYQAYFLIEIPVKSGTRYKIDADVSGDHKVVFTIADMAVPDIPLGQFAALGQKVVPNMTYAVPGGGFVIIPSK